MEGATRRSFASQLRNCSTSAPHVTRMTQTVMPNAKSHPVDARPLGPYAVVLVADALTQLIEQAWLLAAIATGRRGGFVRNMNTVHKNNMVRKKLIAMKITLDRSAGLHSSAPAYTAYLLAKTR